VIAEVDLPAAGTQYCFRALADINVTEAANLLAKALSDISDGKYLNSRNSCLAWKKDGQLLDMRKTLRECGVENGSELLLI
jgi:hypothetical protein